MFHVTSTTFKFNRNQLGTVSAFVMISVPWSNQRAHQVTSENKLNDLILNLTPENMTQHSRIE